MRTIRRTMVASALALPLTLGFAGVAAADTGSTVDTGATSNVEVTSVANGHNGSSGEGEFNGSFGLGLSLEALLEGNFESDFEGDEGDHENDRYDNDGLLGGLLR